MLVCLHRIPAGISHRLQQWCILYDALSPDLQGLGDAADVSLRAPETSTPLSAATTKRPPTLSVPFDRYAVREQTLGHGLLRTETKRLTGMMGHASLGPPGLPSTAVLSGRQVSVVSSTVGLSITPGMPATGKRSQPQSLCLAACCPVSRCMRNGRIVPYRLALAGKARHTDCHGSAVKGI